MASGVEAGRCTTELPPTPAKNSVISAKDGAVATDLRCQQAGSVEDTLATYNYQDRNDTSNHKNRVTGRLVRVCALRSELLLQTLSHVVRNLRLARHVFGTDYGGGFRLDRVHAVGWRPDLGLARGCRWGEQRA